ncbi:MAG: alanine racemase [Alphaproteobacteria bacterium]|nr:alanine racemase [Alphaproteobacteria bacterium]
MHPGPTLTVNLAALTANYQLLKQRFSGDQCAAVVKANAYGLGVAPVAQALWQAGCRCFFVATLEEGVELRAVLPEALIYVFHGPYPGQEPAFPAHRLMPVINSPAQLARWPEPAPFALHVDTGMNRLGFTLTELEAARPQLLSRNLGMLLSHLSCANEPEHRKNARQLARFRAATAMLPDVPASLCNSSGIFLNRHFHFHLARPGCALYGINPTSGTDPMQNVATLTAPILQIRTMEETGSVGYGATFRAAKGSRIAIAQLGYADGLLRALSNQGAAFIAGARVPIAGRVSMDMVALDVTGLPEQNLAQADTAEFINARQTVNDVARAAGSIGYEIFTRLGHRVRRIYHG